MSEYGSGVGLGECPDALRSFRTACFSLFRRCVLWFLCCVHRFVTTHGIVLGVLFRLSIVTATLAVGTLSAAKPSVLRVYFIGNSVTDTVRYDELRPIWENCSRPRRNIQRTAWQVVSKHADAGVAEK